MSGGRNSTGSQTSRIQVPESMKPVKLTVALPTFNRASTYLPAAINAILAQTYKDFELLVLDNGSVDNTAQFILGLNDSRIRYIRNPVGTPVEFNHLSAFHIGLGQRIIVTHDDDIMEPEMLEKQMRFMDDNPGLRLVWTNVTYINESGSVINTPPNGNGNRVFGPGEYILNFPNERLWPLPSTVMMSRGLIRPRDIEVHYFRSRTLRRKASHADVAGLADVTFPAFANIKASIGFLDEPLLRYRIHATQYSNKTNISTPGVYLYASLRDFSRRSLKNNNAAALFNSHIYRFRIQDRVCSTEATLAASFLRSIQGQLKKVCDQHPQNDVLYPLLTVHLLLKNHGLDSELDRLLPELPVPAQHTTAARFLHAWARLAAEGCCLFDGLGREQRIVILGSAFVSALLILEARRYGYQVLACIDSNANRQGRMLLNTPVHAPDWLAANRDQLDLVLLSSEKDHESSLREMIHRHAGKMLPVLSWKDLPGSATSLARVSDTVE